MAVSQDQATPKWRRRKEQRPDEVLQAALKVFVEKGFGAARLEDIAAEAGISKGTIYLYFASKEDVFEALVQETLKPNLAAMAAAIESFKGSNAELLRHVLGLAGDFISKPPLVYFPRLIVGEGARFPRLAEFYHREIISFGMSLIAGMLMDCWSA
jgi:AcrR family transcriptional regulator